MNSLFNNPFSKIFTFVVEKLEKKFTRNNIWYTSSSVVLDWHYNYTVKLLISLYILLLYYQLYDELIYCVSSTNSKLIESNQHLISICLMYPYYEINDVKFYILFYKWIPCILLMMACLFYIPKFLVTTTNCHTTENFLIEISDKCIYYSDNEERECVNIIVSYIERSRLSNNILYYNSLLCHILCFLLCDVGGFLMLDFCLQGQFLSYIPNSYPFNRDIDNVSDGISQIFRRSVECEIGMNNFIYGATEKYKCHLLNMDLYEKIFAFLWCWMLLLSIFTFIYIIFLFSLLSKYVKYFFIRYSLLNKRHSHINVSQFYESVGIGDIYLLYRVKLCISNNVFINSFINVFKNISKCLRNEQVKPSTCLTGLC